MSKVTITAHTEDNAPAAEVPARAALQLRAALRPAQSFSEQFSDLVRTAVEYRTNQVDPAHMIHSWADAAHAEAEAESEAKAALNTEADAAWHEWERRCEAYRELVDPVLDLVAESPEQLLAQVDAFTNLMVPVWAYKTSADTEIEKLGGEDITLLAVTMHEGLKRLSSGSAPALPSFTPTGDGGAFAHAVKRREALRAAASEFEDANESDISQEAQRELSNAEMAVFLTPAPDLDAVLWKLEDNMITEQGVDTVAEALAELDAGDLGEKCEANVYRDLLRLAEKPIPHATPRLMAAE